MNFEGRLLGNRYELIEKIGAGGMATVYKANDHILNRYVAVKILRDEFTTDNEFIRRFNTEAQAAARLAHPNIVSIYDVGNEGNVYFIVMELIQGKTLKEIIDEEGTISWKWSVNIAIQIASALEMAHRNNIIHRDIKPHNIIITEEGVAKVTDFGIAKAVSNSTITAFGTTIGSVHYFSPEHARGGFTDAKSDIYSLGVVMYEMLTGRVPFDADTPVSVALKHMQEVAVEPIKINPLIPESLNRIIVKAMQKDPNERYQTATDMLRDLRQVTKNPSGDYVVIDKYKNDSPTQRINLDSTKVVEEHQNKAEPKNEEKKKNKLMVFLNKHKILKVLLILLICVIVFGVAMLTTIKVIDSKKPKQIQIPNVVGKSLQEVKAITDEAGIKYDVAGEAFSADVEAGLVISQEPKYADNYKVLENSVLKVTVSKGLEMTNIPKLVGLTKQEAENELNKAGLKMEIKEETSEKIEQNYVISQEPEEGKEIPKGSTVAMTVSLGRGIEEVDVPNVIGKTEEEAKKAIEGAKLKAQVKYEENTSKSDGIVIKQDKEGGSKADEGSTITITVNKWPESHKATINVKLKEITQTANSKTSSKGQNSSSTNTTSENTIEDKNNSSSSETKPSEPEIKSSIVKIVANGTSVKEATAKPGDTVTGEYTGTGKVDISVTVDGNLKQKTIDLTANDATVDFEY